MSERITLTVDELVGIREHAYMEGSRAVARSLLGLLALFLDGDEKQVARLLIARDAARAALRQICEEFGDNDWPDDLHLADVIDKHLARHLRQKIS